MGELARSGDVPIVPPSYSPCPRPSAAPPPIGGRFITTNPARSKCSTRRRATTSAMISSALCARLRPWKAQREGKRVGDVPGGCGRQLVGGVDHRREDSHDDRT